jgi:hypothetical protein
MKTLKRLRISDEIRCKGAFPSLTIPALYDELLTGLSHRDSYVLERQEKEDWRGI